MRRRHPSAASEALPPGVRRPTDYWPYHLSTKTPDSRRRAVLRVATAALAILLGGGLVLFLGYEAVLRRAAVRLVRPPGAPGRLWVEGPVYLSNDGLLGDGAVRVAFVETAPDGSVIGRRDQIVAVGPWGVVRGSRNNPDGDRWRESLTQGG